MENVGSNMRDEPSEYLQAVLDKDVTRAKSTIIRLLEAGRDPVEVFEILGQAQVAIGDLWEAKTISVADEHFATQVAIDLVSKVASRLPPPSQKRGKAVSFNCEGEFHNVALRIFSSLLKPRGWNVEFLGDDTPFSRLIEQLRRREKVDLLCVSITMDFNLPKLIDSLRKLRRDAQLQTLKVIVGGRLLRSAIVSAALSEEVDGRKLADYVAQDVRSGLEYVEKLGRAGFSN